MFKIKYNWLVSYICNCKCNYILRDIKTQQIFICKIDHFFTYLLSRLHNEGGVGLGKWGRWDEWDEWDKWEIPIKRVVTYQALAPPSLPSSFSASLNSLNSLSLRPHHLPLCTFRKFCYLCDKRRQYAQICVVFIFSLFYDSL